MGEFVMQHWHFVATQTACHLLIVPTENIIGKRLGAHRARIAENNRSCAVYILYIAVLRAESISFFKAGFIRQGPNDNGRMVSRPLNHFREPGQKILRWIIYPEPVIAFKTGGILLLNINAQTIAYLQKIIAGRIMGGSDMVDVMLLIGKNFVIYLFPAQ